MAREIYIFAGGGTGGHLYPGLAVARELHRARPEAGIVFACSDRAIDRRILDPLPYAVVPQEVRPLPRRPGHLWPFLRAWRRSKVRARRMIDDLSPAAVLGLGGFAAAPLVRAAAAAGVPTGLLNPDAVPGKANRYLARHVDVIFTQFDATSQAFAPGFADRIRFVGCPIRRELLGADRDTAVETFGLQADLRTLLVLGGSQGAESINHAVSALAASDALAELAESWQILHIAGPAKAFRAADTPLARLPLTRLEYCDRMDLAYAAADLALCRGGASTVAELAATATPAVILPYPFHADRQQHLNARAAVDAGAAVICEDRKSASQNVAALRQTLVPILQDPSRPQAMATAAGAIGKPEAAHDAAVWMLR